MATIDARVGSLDFTNSKKAAESEVKKPRGIIDFHGLLMHQRGMLYNGATSTLTRIFRSHIGGKDQIFVESPYGIKDFDSLTGENTALFITPTPDQARPLPGLDPCLLEVKLGGESLNPLRQVNADQQTFFE